MSYQVLARKWRPRIFSEMAGQEHVLQALVNALDNDRLHHAYLFTGTRGVGKTTIARILAKCLNCEQGVSSVPCGECSACQGIAEGRFVDLIEVDAASRTKVEDTRELLENVQYAPTAGRYKVYLIDEVHMLSGHSFNALLKTLEEPPPHVKFLLATTDPQKLPVTILSRCLQFNLKNLSPERIVEHLQFVLAEEKVPFEEAGLWSLARAADGSMRDALSLTDQAIAHGGGKLADAEISAMLGTIDLSVVIEIATALVERDGELALDLVKKMAEHATDFGTALAELTSVWHRVAIAQVVPDALDNRHGDHQAIIALAARLSREDVQLFYQIALLARRDLPLSPDSQSGFEMALLRMLAFQPAAEAPIDPPSIAANEQVLPQEVVSSVKKPESEPRQPAPALEVKGVQHSISDPVMQDNPDSVSAADVGNANTSPVSANDGVDKENGPETEAVIEARVTQATKAQVSKEQLLQFSHQVHQGGVEPARAFESEPVGSSESMEQTPESVEQVVGQSVGQLGSGQGLDRIELSQLSPDNWIALYQNLSVSGVIQNVAANLVLIERQGNKLSFALDINNSSLYKESHRERFQQVLSEYFAEAVTVEIEIDKVSTETPQANMLRLRAERQAAAVETMKTDANVQQMIERFDARLLEHTVRPADQKDTCK